MSLRSGKEGTWRPLVKLASPDPAPSEACPSIPWERWALAELPDPRQRLTPRSRCCSRAPGQGHALGSTLLVGKLPSVLPGWVQRGSTKSSERKLVLVHVREEENLPLGSGLVSRCRRSALNLFWPAGSRPSNSIAPLFEGPSPELGGAEASHPCPLQESTFTASDGVSKSFQASFTSKQAVYKTHFPVLRWAYPGRWGKAETLFLLGLHSFSERYH